jgi:hypothetical protein
MLVKEPNERYYLEVCFLVHLTVFYQLYMLYCISSPGVPTQRRVDNIKMEVRKIGLEDMLIILKWLRIGFSSGIL